MVLFPFFIWGVTSSTDVSESHAIYTPFRDSRVGIRLEVDVAMKTQYQLLLILESV
jgi:hypothetical protein